MSGSGGGSFFGGNSPSFDCNLLSIRTQLASPDPAVILTLSRDEILDVVLVSSTGPIQLVTNSGQIAGAVLPTVISQLIQCISDGHEYIAKVLEIRGGNCQVLIIHK